MAKNRDQRYASTADLLLDLEAIASGEPPLQACRDLEPIATRGQPRLVHGKIQRIAGIETVRIRPNRRYPGAQATALSSVPPTALLVFAPRTA